MIRVHKFGGASVKDEQAIRNMADIVKSLEGRNVVVVSAMGKTTNAMEAVVRSQWEEDGKAIGLLNDILEKHKEISLALMPDSDPSWIDELANDVIRFMEDNRSSEYTFIYDQIVSLGEQLSTTLIYNYLSDQEIDCEWLDIRRLFTTDRAYTEAKINWEKTSDKVLKYFSEEESQLIITQGFLGSTPEGFTTTLGREGSDYTAAVLGYCLDAESVNIYKDVPGVLNSDPKQFEDAVLMPKISFLEAIEMSFYGAKVIHPKTIKPLQNKEIPFFVKSFVDPESPGTEISNRGEMPSLPPVIVFREKQVLVSFAVKDFSFVGAENLSLIYKALADQRLHLNMSYNGAISFSVCLDNKVSKIKALIEELKDEFDIKLEEGLELLTIRHYDEDTIQRFLPGRKVILEERTDEVVQLLLRQR